MRYRHLASPRFWTLYEALPTEVRALADKNFALLKSDPRHPSLHLKKLSNLWSVRVGEHYRALGTDVKEGIYWFWIALMRSTIGLSGNRRRDGSRRGARSNLSATRFAGPRYLGVIRKTAQLEMRLCACRPLEEPGRALKGAHLLATCLKAC
jgi:hypothetical protein